MIITLLSITSINFLFQLSVSIFRIIHFHLPQHCWAIDGNYSYGQYPVGICTLANCERDKMTSYFTNRDREGTII